jgi:hypothetical protein
MKRLYNKNISIYIFMKDIYNVWMKKEKKTNNDRTDNNYDSTNNQYTSYRGFPRAASETNENVRISFADSASNVAPTILNPQFIHKPIKWTPDNELIMVEWCDIAQCYKWLHSKCHRKLSIRQAWFTIPSIALSTISGTASFAQASLPDDIQVYAPMAIGTINILIGISTTIQQYLKIAELSESHRISAISWDKFARNIRIELAKDPDERMDAGQFLKICRSEFDRLMETSPSIDERTVEQFNEAFQGAETETQKKEQEIKQQQRFYALRKPDICNIIISADESRHKWYKDQSRVNMMNSQYNDENTTDIEADQDNEQVQYEENQTKNNSPKYDTRPSYRGSLRELWDKPIYDEGEVDEISSQKLEPRPSTSSLRINSKEEINSSNVPKSPMNKRRLSQDYGIKPSVEFANDTKSNSEEGLNTGKNKQADMEALTRKIKNQNAILNDFIARFVDSVGRKPDEDEIRDNLSDMTDTDILESFLKDYKLWIVT